MSLIHWHSVQVVKLNQYNLHKFAIGSRTSFHYIFYNFNLPQTRNYLLNTSNLQSSTFNYHLQSSTSIYNLPLPSPSSTSTSLRSYKYICIVNNLINFITQMLVQYCVPFLLFNSHKVNQVHCSIRVNCLVFVPLLTVCYVNTC